jgi:GTPase Era involved in 16S rRNA processing
VNDSSGLFLAIIAGATLVMALIQVGAIVAILRIARQAQETLAAVQRDVKPLLAKVNDVAEDARPLVARANAIAEEASRTAAIATAQAQKIDQLVTVLSRRVDETSAVVQQAVVTPAREGIAIVAAIRAAVGAFRGNDFRGRTGRPSDEDDALFIG